MYENIIGQGEMSTAHLSSYWIGGENNFNGAPIRVGLKVVRSSGDVASCMMNLLLSVRERRDMMADG